MTSELAEERRADIERGLAAYHREREILRRVIRRHGRLHQDEFDRIFGGFSRGAMSMEYFRPAGESYILGGLHRGNWFCWLDLLQWMIVLGEVDADMNEARAAIEYKLCP